MALNLWKLGGKPTSYNPLPNGYNQVNLNELGKTYILRFKAKSASSAYFRVSNGQFTNTMYLTPNSTQYEFEYTRTNGTPTFWLHDTNLANDIIIDNIELFQKPLPKITLNGVDGFTSGKWTLHANTTVIDDETLVLNATSGIQNSYFDIPCLPNQTLTLSSIVTGTGTASLDIQELSSLKSFIKDNAVNIINGGNVSVSATTSSNTYFIRVILYSQNSGQYTFKRPMLNLGSTPAPYSRKTGDKMVLPVVKKNLIADNPLNWSTYAGSTIVATSDTYLGYPVYKVTLTGNVLSRVFPVLKKTSKPVSSSVYIKRTPNSQYDNIWYGLRQINFGTVYSGNAFAITDQWQQFITENITVTDDYMCLFYHTDTNRPVTEFYIACPMIEESTSVTSYEPYAVQANKKVKKPIVISRTGLVFNGTSDYLQLPSMTMDSVEIECLIDSVQRSGGNAYLIDARPGISGWIYSGAPPIGSGFTEVKIDGVIKTDWVSIPKDVRTKIAIKATQFNDNLNIFSSNTNGSYLKGILYKVTCYLGGQIVAQYDFENASNIVGTNVLQNGVNLIPSFEDTRWSLHANTQVLGKHLLKLNATGAFQSSYFDLLSGGNLKYLVSCRGTDKGLYYVDEYDNNGVKTRNVIGLYLNLIPISFTTLSTTVRLRITLSNDIVGTFDFSKPQLYLLNGTEGILNGTPTPARKQSRRTQYAKR